MMLFEDRFRFKIIERSIPGFVQQMDIRTGIQIGRGGVERIYFNRILP